LIITSKKRGIKAHKYLKILRFKGKKSLK